jgi:biopolymer transport protein ExbD
MAHIDDGGGNGKRTVAVDVNIVPFIDLMSVLIIFLLITAVWTQVSMIQLGSSMYAKKNLEEDKKVDPPPHAQIPLRLDIKYSGYRLVKGREQVSIDKLNGEYDVERLKAELKSFKDTYQDKEDAVVFMSEKLEYEQLIVGMDALLSSGFPQVSIATGEAE